MLINFRHNTLRTLVHCCSNKSRARAVAHAFLSEIRIANQSQKFPFGLPEIN
jgi:hypothetical protein